jgi:hypothetical protein
MMLIHFTSGTPIVDDEGGVEVRQFADDLSSWKLSRATTIDAAVRWLKAQGHLEAAHRALELAAANHWEKWPEQFPTPAPSAE